MRLLIGPNDERHALVVYGNVHIHAAYQLVVHCVNEGRIIQEKGYHVLAL